MSFVQSMQTQDVLARLKRATTDRVPTTGDDRTVAAGEFVLGDTCQNCGRDRLAARVEERTLVPRESADDRNRVTLCDDCHADAPTAEPSTADAPTAETPTADGGRVADADRREDANSAAAPGSATGANTLSFQQCAHDGHVVDVDAVRDRDDRRCRGCGVREHIVVGSDLHVHPVVPIDATGYRHAHNYVSLCPSCHQRLH